MTRCSSCKLCECSLNDINIDYRNFIWDENELFEDLRIEFCNNCGLGIAAPIPIKTDLDNFYINEYRDQRSPFHLNFANMTRAFKRDHRSIAQLLLARQFKDLSHGDVFVDLGPGRGTSFDEINQIFGPNCIESWAIEFSADAADYYKNSYNVDTHTNLIELSTLKNKRVDLLLSSHSLEHFTFDQAVNFINDLHEAMSINGCAIFEVPHVDLRIHQDVRDGDDPHLLFFSKTSLKMLFEKCNFDVLFIETCGPAYAKRQNSNQAYKQNYLLKAQYKKRVRKVLNLFPKVANFIASIFFDKKIKLKDENFSYGGNRHCLRIVVTPNNNSRSNLDGLRV